MADPKFTILLSPPHEYNKSAVNDAMTVFMEEALILDSEVDTGHLEALNILRATNSASAVLDSMLSKSRHIGENTILLSLRPFTQRFGDGYKMRICVAGMRGGYGWTALRFTKPLAIPEAAVAIKQLYEGKGDCFGKPIGTIINSIDSNMDPVNWTAKVHGVHYDELVRKTIVKVLTDLGVE